MASIEQMRWIGRRAGGSFRAFMEKVRIAAQNWAPTTGAIARTLPGLALAAALALLAMGLRVLPGLAALSPMILAVLLALGVQMILGRPSWARPGLAIAVRPALRLGIVLLGAQLSLQQVMQLGGPGIAIVVAALASTFLFTLAMGRGLGVDRQLTQLLAAGTAVCGASAIVAANAVSRGTDEDTAYAMAAVTLFGTIAMVALPLLGQALALDPIGYGLWAGAATHEVAQAVAAAFQFGPLAGETGTVAKLGRVILLAPLVAAMGLWAARRDGNAGRNPAPVPLFVVGFAAMIGANSLGLVPQMGRTAAAALAPFLLTMALAALGLTADLERLRAKGLRPLALGALSSLFIAGFTLVLILLVY